MSWYTAGSLAGLPGMPGTERGVLKRARHHGWQSRKRPKGKGAEYHISSLPAETRAHLAAAQQWATERETDEARAGELEGRRLAVGQAVEQGIQQRTQQAGLHRLTALQGAARDRAEAKLAILGAVDEYARDAHLPYSRAIHAFCAAYNADHLSIGDDIHRLIPDVHPATLYRWRRRLQHEGADKLGGKYGNRRGTSNIDTQEPVRRLVVAMLTQHSPAGPRQIRQALRTRLGGVEGIELPSQRSLERWVNQWRAEHREVYTAVTNPDRWKNDYMAAYGSASEGIDRVNQRWELDSTPADVMLEDGRHSLIGIIDVASRRAKLHVSKTSKATAIGTVTRRALEDWGVPEEAKTDNGLDYTSKYLTRVFQSLGVDHHLCTPYASWEKPHIERSFRTFAHDLVELLPGYIGHNVAERQALESRHSFADKLTKKSDSIQIRMTAAELQRFCDRWTESIYHQRPHDGLGGRTPFEIAAAARDAIRRVEEPRVLDVLLAEAPGTRVVGKKGIKLDRLTYIAPELVDAQGERVHVRYDPDDVGRIWVYHRGEFLCIAECPEVTGISRQEVAAMARERQKARVQQARRDLRQAAKEENTRDIAYEILDQAESSHNLIQFPPPSTPHETPDIAAARDTVDALDRHGQSDEPAPVDETALRRVQALAREEQIEDETAEDRFRRWIRLHQAGEAISDIDAAWLRQYEQTSEYHGRRLIYDDFGGIPWGVAEE